MVNKSAIAKFKRMLSIILCLAMFVSSSQFAIADEVSETPAAATPAPTPVVQQAAPASNEGAGETVAAPTVTAALAPESSDVAGTQTVETAPVADGTTEGGGATASDEPAGDESTPPTGEPTGGDTSSDAEPSGDEPTGEPSGDGEENASYNISVSGAHVTFDLASYSVTEGGSVTISWTIEDGYTFSGVTVDGAAASASYAEATGVYSLTLENVTADQTLVVTTEATTPVTKHTVSITGDHVAPVAGSYEVEEGQNVTVEWRVESGFRFVGATLDGMDVSSDDIALNEGRLLPDAF